MSKSKPHRYYKFYILVVVVEAFSLVVLLNSCARSHHRSNESDSIDAETVSDSTVTETEVDSGMVHVDASQVDGNNTANLNGDTFVPPDDNPDFDIPDPQAIEPPEEVIEAMDTLKEPDFTQPMESLAEENCGYIFKAESTTDWAEVYDRSLSVRGQLEPIAITTATTETRLFDKTGRLIAAEIEFDPIVMSPASYETLQSIRRFQIDYDQSGRPVRVRISPALSASGTGSEETESTGSVIQIEYQDDGSSQSLYITGEIELIAASSLHTNDGYNSLNTRPAPEGWFFCDWLRFDPYGKLLDRKWDCNKPTVVQTRTYDDQQRLLSDHGFYLYDLSQYHAIPIGWTDSIHIGEWRVDARYNYAEHRETIVWMGHEDGSIPGHHWVISGMTFSSEPVQHRMVHTYDESSGRPIRSEYDHENDGTFDELVSYTYQDGELLSKEFDFWIDGIVDVVELHTRSPTSHLIERRNMTQRSDVMYSSQSIDAEIIQTFGDSTALLPSQSQSIIELTSDDQSRLVAIDVEIRWAYEYVPADSQTWQQALVSESWHETAVYADEGYVREKQLTWQPSDEWVKVRENEQSRNLSGSVAPYLFNATAQSTTCTLTHLCEGEVVLPEDERLLTCEAGVVFPQYRLESRMPSITQDDVFTLPPYDAVPGMQNALKSQFFHSYTFPRAPIVKNIVGY